MERIVHQLVQAVPNGMPSALSTTAPARPPRCWPVQEDQKRTELLHMKHTGLPKEFSQWLQDNDARQGPRDRSTGAAVRR